jgi:hypothetical protein
LCAGIAASAERLRNAAYLQPGRPGMASADTLQYTAAAARIACHLTSVVMRHVLDGQADAVPAAGSAIRASGAWQQVADTWRSFRTDTPHAHAQPVSDASDLITRLGRLAFDDPAWIPAHGARLPHRDPQQIRNVLAGVHQTADALARMAATDLTTLAEAVTAGHLYAITEASSSSGPAHPRYGKAGGRDSERLRDAYLGAITATSDLASRMDHIAMTRGCRTIALARARLAAPVRQDITWPGHLIAEPPDRRADDTTPEPAADPRDSGRLEQQLKVMGIRDPSLLLRAHTIDRAAQDVLRQAAARASGRDPRKRPGRPHGTELSR